MCYAWAVMFGLDSGVATGILFAVAVLVVVIVGAVLERRL